MKQTVAHLFVALLLAVAGPTAAAEPAVTPAPAASAGVPAAPLVSAVAQGFLPPREKIEKPYTNDKCLKNCHEQPNFGAGARSGILRDLHVDPKAFLLSIHGQKGVECIDCHADSDPNFHPRAGLRRVDCRACHAAKPPPDAFPADALRKLQAKGIKPPPKESQKGEGWMKTGHAKAWLAKDPAASSCASCHTAHYQRPAKDPLSTVNRANLPNTCGLCHVDQVRSYDVGGMLARFRLAGHGKGDLSDRYEVGQCLSCHQGEAAHGEDTVTKQTCPRCHRVPPKEEREKATVVLSSLHARPLASDQPLAEVLRVAYLLLVWGGAAGVVLLALFMGFSTLYRSKDG
ncbi:MAG: hypothetical protein HZB55_20025 [Deltaproteobacteria bacterium]|nr:hypothetical protein [Deltaproteobacteria bacterium]